MWSRRGLLALVVAVAVVAAGCDAVRVSVSSTGAQANGDSSGASVSADGNLVAFSSYASNLVTGDANDAEDVFVRDLRDNTTSLVSKTASGQTASGISDDATISANGEYVSFRSYASNLIPGASAGAVYVRDLVRGTTTLVSKDAAGVPISGSMGGRSAISSNGRFVAFESGFKVYRYDRVAGYASQVWDYPRQPTGITRDGRYLATDTMSLIGTHSANAVVLDLSTGTGAFTAPSNSWGTQITPDGQYVAYAFAPNCFPDSFPSCTAGPRGARLHNLLTGAEQPIITTLGGDQRVDALGISDDANRIAVATGGNVYRFDRPTGAFTLITVATNKLETGNAPTPEAAISGDGITVGFASPATNLVANDTNGASDIFARRP